MAASYSTRIGRAMLGEPAPDASGGQVSGIDHQFAAFDANVTGSEWWFEETENWRTGEGLSRRLGFCG